MQKLKEILYWLGIVSLLAFPARAASIVPSIPYNLTNGSLADATQVMSNFNTIVTDVNTNACPISSPSFLGTVTFPDGGVWGSLGINTLSSLTTQAFTVQKSASGASVQALVSNTASAANTYAAVEVQTGTSNSSVSLVDVDNNGAPFGEVILGSALNELIFSPVVGINNDFIVKAQNVATGASTTAIYELATGTANSYMLYGLHDNAGSPYGILTMGPALTNLYLQGDNANPVVYHFQNTATGSSVATNISLETGTTNSHVQFNINDNNGSPTASITLGSAVANLTLPTATILGNGTTATTQAANDNSTKAATTAYVDTARKLGSWATAATGTATLASTDGFIVGYSTGANNLTVKTDASNPPTTVRGESGNDGGGNVYGMVMCPVRKGDYWEVVGTSAALFWIPLGN